MRQVGHFFSWFGVLSALALVLPQPASADPIRVTVQFSVAGDPRDADFGRDTSSGSFSIPTTLGPGQSRLDFNGLGADEVSFTWAGTTWTATNADLVALGFDAAGNVKSWSLNGIVPGDSGGTSFNIWPDFSVGCGFCGSGVAGFIYTTPRSLQLGIFTGRVTSFSTALSSTPSPTPEPASLLLVGTGLAGLVTHRHRRRVARL
jgi:hypothetical protein